jgi:hypothetical protein
MFLTVAPVTVTVTFTGFLQLLTVELVRVKAPLRSLDVDFVVKALTLTTVFMVRAQNLWVKAPTVKAPVTTLSTCRVTVASTTTSAVRVTCLNFDRLTVGRTAIIPVNALPTPRNN